MAQVLRDVVGGRSVAARSGRTSDVVDPATGEVFASAPVSGPKDVEAAFSAAATAFETWRDTTPSERQRALLRIADATEACADGFVCVESHKTGKPPALTASEELPPMVDQVRFFAGAARVLRGWRPAGAFSFGRAGLAVNVLALAYGVAAMYLLARPGGFVDRWTPLLGLGVVLVVGLVYLVVRRPDRQSDAPAGDALEVAGQLRAVASR